MIYALLFYKSNAVFLRDPYLVLCYLLYIYIDKTSYLFQFIMFADDTNLFDSHSNLDELLKIVNQEIAKISNWLKINKFSLNVETKHYIIFIIDKIKFPLGLKF